MGGRGFQGRGWLGIGLGASAALHAMAGLWILRLPERAPAPPSGGSGLEIIELQVVSVAGPEGAPPPQGPGQVGQAVRLAAVATGPLEPAAASASRSAGASPAPAAGRGVTSSDPASQEARPLGTPGEAGSENGLAGQEARSTDGPGEAGASGHAGHEAGSSDERTGARGAGAGAPTSPAQLLAARLAAAAVRCYPPEAVRFRLSGEARLSFCLGEDGRASAVSVARSSGAEVLDRAAAECVLPGALPAPGAAGCYTLPVRFAARKP